MGLIHTFKLANNIEGTFVEVGFGKGETAKSVFNAMNNSVLTKRDSHLIDSFKGSSVPTVVDLTFNPSLSEGQDPGRLQLAMDMRYELGNNYSVGVIKSFVGPTLANLYKGGPIAILHIDLPSYSATVAALDVLQPFLTKDAIVYVSGYGASLGITNAVNDYLDDNKLTYQLIKSIENTYILNKVAPVFYTTPTIGRPSIRPEVTLPVSRPKVVPFADRYIKPVVKKFKPKDNILDNVLNVLNPVGKSTEASPEEVIPVSRPSVKPFEDRYTKADVPKFKSKKVITQGLNILDKKVTR